MAELECVSEVTVDRRVHRFEGASDWVEIYRLPQDLEQQLNDREHRRSRFRRSTTELLTWFAVVIAVVVSALAAAAK